MPPSKSSRGVVALYLVMAPTFAWGQSDPCAEVIRAGVALRREGRDADALARFREGAAGCDAPRLRVQIAWAEQALGRWIEARDHLRAALLAAGDPWVDARRDRLALDLRAIEEHIGALHVTGGEAGAAVFIDGHPVATLPMNEPTSLVVGAARLEVRMEGRYTVSRDIHVTSGTVAREHVELRRVVPDVTPVAAPPVATTPSPPPSSVALPTPSTAPRTPSTASLVASPWRVVGWSLVALGGAALVAGGASLVLRERAAADFNALGAAQCFESMGVAYGGAACEALHDDVATWERVGAVTLALGAAASVAGAITLWRVAVSARPVAVACEVSARGFQCEGRF